MTRTLRLTLITSLLAPLLFAVAPVPTAHAATFTVTKTADTADGTCDADCSLREAIIAANAAAGDDTITVPAGTYTLTIAPDLTPDDGLDGDLDITGNITINGAGAGSTIIDGGALDRVFHVTGAFTVNISGVTVRNGNFNGLGGGIYNSGGTLTITNSTFSGNSAAFGGGIYNENALTVANSTISGNSATTHGGGGIYIATGTATISNGTISGNGASTHGGGIYLNDATLTVSNSTISGNSASIGGGILAGGTLTITNSTISGNSATTHGGGMWFDHGTLTVTNSTFSGNGATNNGGGIFNSFGTLTITNSTFSGNSAANGGGGVRSAGGTVTLKNTIVANSTSGGNCNGTITDGGNNLDSANTCGFTTNAKINTDPNLGALTGSPQYFPLNTGSAAIDAGDNSVCAAAPVNNASQNGVTRPTDGDGNGTAICDIGSYEAPSANANLSNLTLSSGTLTPAFAAGTTAYTANVANSVTSITVTPTAADTNAIITVNGTTVASGSPSGAINLNVGANTITIVVTAQDGTTTKTYTVVVTRAAASSCIPSAAFSGSATVSGGNFYSINCFSGHVYVDNGEGRATGGNHFQGSVTITSTGTMVCVQVPPGYVATTPTCVTDSGGGRKDFGIRPIAQPPSQTTTGAQSVGASGGAFNCSSRWTLTIPADVLPDNSSLQCGAFDPNVTTSAPSGFRFMGQMINVLILDNTGAARRSFNPPLTFCFTYTDSDLLAAGGDPNNFVIQTAHIGGAWTTMATTVNPSAGSGQATATRQVCATTDHLTLFELAAKVPTSLPVTGENFTPFILIAALIGALAIVGAVGILTH